MGIVELLGLAASVSLLSGWRLYLTVFGTGLAMHFGVVDLPENLKMLDALANPWVIGIAGLGALAEFFADKIAWLDSIWDGLNTLIRPLGGALLALAVVDAGDPVWQVIVFLLGGGAALASHATKATARAAVNTSPEPVSNIVLSTAEDVVTGGLLALAFANPLIAAVIALVLLGLAIWGLFAAKRMLAKLLAPAPQSGPPPQA
ncbi:MAG: DUF4126 domain-containing protein [Sphingomonadales bacterium]|jgi:hypothetical protein|nr:DUF4126 domain-containing protein [Sphingomonadales bacterium]MBK9002551.1 DUF4126 domain-containing protein [Sphingomonadales bacterium]MBK9267771.1 DUF4126 domain-containing protein [Sphingomonadales bacterium]MBP6433447.1 DUF4126 domain-containing protein [Sphingorhabdus sp.]